MSDTVKVITTVGASILTNFNSPAVQSVLKQEITEKVGFKSQLTDLLRGSTPLSRDLENIESQVATYFLWNMRLVEERGVKASRKWTYSPKEFGLNHHASAEIQSTLEMLEHPAFKGKSIQLFLLCTDTVVAQLAARLVKQAFEKEFKVLDIDFIIEIKIVKGLRILDKKKFEDEGFDAIFKTISDIHHQHPKNGMTCLNITGGYKSILPVLTIIAQLYKYPLYYVFEFASVGTGKDVLLEIPPLPLQFDWAMIDLWSTYLSQKTIDQVTLSDQERTLFQQQLLPNRLFALHDDDYRRTNLGTIFHHYIEQQTPHGKTVLGYLVEYKCLDWYLKEPYRGFQAQHSIVLDGVEMDVLLRKNNPEQFIWVEVKSFNQICHAYNKSKSGRENYNPKLSRYLKKLTEENLQKIKSFHLVVYYQKFQELSNYHFNRNLGRLQRKLAEKDITDFKVFVVNIDLGPEGLSGYQNPYTQKLMNQRLTGDEELATQPNHLLVKPYEEYLMKIT